MTTLHPAFPKKVFIPVLLILSILLSVLLPTVLFAQELHNDFRGTFKGKVVDVISEQEEVIAGTETQRTIQELEIEITSGPQKGEIREIRSDFIPLEEGDRFYFNYNVHIDGTEVYGITNIDRTGSLVVLVILFAVAVIALSGWQGVRSLIGLAASFFAIFYILVPGLLNGWNPILASTAIATVVLFAAIFFTHGFNRESTVAYVGTMCAVLVTSLFSLFAVDFASLSGYTSEEAVYLNINTQGVLNFTSLLLGAIIIGVLGVLDDIAVTQAAVVTELYNSNKELSRKEVFSRALRVGREHVGALVNTLILAYTGAALPLILYAYASPSSFEMAANSEIFATEIVRSIVGSIGLILTVPIVTLLAVFYLKNYKGKGGHSHAHSHAHGHTH
jgi:uncharacterized membrane protein